MKVWVVLYTDYVEGEQVLGVFASEDEAKLYIGDYVLKNEINSDFLELVKKKVEVSTQ